MISSTSLTMDFGLPGEINEMRDMVERWCIDRVAPIAAEIDSTNTFPRHLWPEMGELGLFGITVSEEFGGIGMGYLAYSVALERVYKASGAVGISYGAHTNLCVNQLELNGSPEQKRKYMPKLLSGEHVGALAMSEHGAGSDVVSMALRAEEKGDHFLLNGTKMWITNGPQADTLIVYAKTDPQAGSKGITAFIVERDFEGFSPSPKLDKFGHRGSDTSELVFEDCRVPKENVLGQVNGGVRVLMSGLDYERLTFAAGAVGIMEAALDIVLPQIHDRKQFGQPIGEFQLVQAKIADMYTAMNSGRAYLYMVAKAADEGRITRQDSAAVLLYTAERSVQCALDAIQLMGGNGYMNDCPAGRLLRDAKLMEIGAGTTQIRRVLIGREIFQKSI